MERKELVKYLESSGKDPARLIFEDELTGLYNRRYLFHFLHSKINWDHADKNPLSLLMLDLDHFKKINDEYGHQAGDQALVWLAGHLKSIAGSNGLPIRYAGDEFMLLFQRCNKINSLNLGKQLIENVRNNPFKYDHQDGNLDLTISLGIASAPGDAKDGKSLIRQADTALYSAKRNGRDRMVDAAEVSPTEVFDKTASYQLKEVRIVGRGRQLSLVADALKIFNDRKSQFLIAEGAAGMGKSDFLETVRHNLARSKTLQCIVRGSAQEMGRPYYLIEKILIHLLNQLEDKGAALIEKLTADEQAYLSGVLPPLLLGTSLDTVSDKDESARREGLFDTLLKTIPRLVNLHPLVLFIDDLHYGDEATLMLFRRLMMRGDFPLFICASSDLLHESKKDERPGHLEHFYETYRQELDIQKFSLTPLTSADIDKHIRELFPNIKSPEGLSEELAAITQGNPLFFTEILHKLVSDRKILLTGKQWSIEPLEEGYLPRSLEEIVTEKIASLDQDTRQMLDRVSALGEGVALSKLIGSSDEMEARVLEFVDKAVAQGLLSADFQANDEIVRFLGKRILDITYNAIEPERKGKIHEQLGRYHESLYQQNLLPSAATLAYHFKRSTDQQKAETYEQVLSNTNSAIYNSEEAALYTGESLGEALATDDPIRESDIALVPRVIRDFMVAIRNIKLYPPGSKSIIGVISQSIQSLKQVLENNSVLSLMQIKEGLVVNGQKMDVSEIKMVADRFLSFLNSNELKGISFHAGLTARELEILIEAFGRPREKMFDDRYWERFINENDLQHVELKQIRYTMAEGQRKSGAKPLVIGVAGTALGSEQHDLPLIPSILKGLLGAAKIIRLYPIESKAVSSAIDQLLQRLNIVLDKQDSLTISHADRTLLINGERVDVSDFKTFAESFGRFLDTLGLSSIAFVKGLSRQELATFINALGNLPPEGTDAKFWKDFSRTHDVSKIVFDEHVYNVKIAQRETSGGIEAAPTFLPPFGAGANQPSDMPMSDEDFDAYLSSFHDLIQELFDKGAEDKAKLAVEQQFLGLPQRNLLTREKVIDIDRSLMEILQSAFQHAFARFLTDPMVDVFPQERDAKLIAEMAGLMNLMFTSLIGFVDYVPASRLIAKLQERHKSLTQTKDPNAAQLGKHLELRLTTATQKLLLADIKSSDAERHNNAIRLLESLGHISVPLLINIIKQEDDFRARQAAATILAKQGPKAANRLKQLMVLEISPDERVRLLENIDTVTTDLVSELLHALGDENKKVRLAAFRLAERLKDTQVVGMLLDNARKEKGEMAVAAVNALEKIRPPEAVAALCKILKSTRNEELRVACCRALGRIAKPECVEPLADLLSRRNRLLRRYRFSDQVRATAAFALGQIPQARAVKTLAAYVDDPDQRIRDVARNVLKRVKAAALRQNRAAAAAKSPS